MLYVNQLSIVYSIFSCFGGVISPCLLILFLSLCTGDSILKFNYLEYTPKAKCKVCRTVIHTYGFCHFKLIGCIFSPSL